MNVVEYKMKTSEQINEISEALAKFTADKPVISKDKNVSMKGMSKGGSEYKVSYDYAPLEVLQESIKPVLAKNGLFVTQMLGMNGHLTGIYTRVGHKSGQFIESFWPINLDSVTKEQDRGSKLTYNKRYAYAAALDLILSDEDNDAVGVENNKQSAKAEAPVSTVYTKKYYKDDLLPNPADFVVEFGKRFKGKKLSEIPLESIDESIEYWHKHQQGQRSSLTGNIRAFMVNANEYLITKGFYPPDLTDEEIK